MHKFGEDHREQLHGNRGGVVDPKVRQVRAEEMDDGENLRQCNMIRGIECRYVLRMGVASQMDRGESHQC